MIEKIELTVKEADEICRVLGDLKLEVKEAQKVIEVVHFFQKKFTPNNVEPQQKEESNK